MGANQFCITMKGIYKSPKEAFWQAVEQASYEHGHGGYTGTIAEKNDFKMVDLPKRKNVYDFIDECLRSEDGFWNDKWGPAACVEIKGSQLANLRDESYKGKKNFKAFIFFGWASS